MGILSLKQYKLGETPTTPCREFMGGRTGHGYGVAFLDGKWQAVHRWVVEKLEDKPFEIGDEVMHHCDNPPCYLYEHLKRSNKSDNMLDAHLKGRVKVNSVKGVDHPKNKLTEEQVLIIRSLKGKANQYDLAREYGVAQTTISAIQRGLTWRHI